MQWPEPQYVPLTFSSKIPPEKETHWNHGEPLLNLYEEEGHRSARIIW